MSEFAPKDAGHAATALNDAFEADVQDPSAFSTWGNPETLEKHLNDHAEDFGIDPEAEDAIEQYAKKANEFYQKFQIDNLPAVKYPNGGEIGVYEPETNTFGVYTSSGQTMSFYKPTSPSYFEREVLDTIDRGGNIINPLPPTNEVTPDVVPLTVQETAPMLEGGTGNGGRLLPQFNTVYPHEIMQDDDEPKL